MSIARSAGKRTQTAFRANSSVTGPRFVKPASTAMSSYGIICSAASIVPAYSAFHRSTCEPSSAKS